MADDPKTNPESGGDQPEAPITLASLEAALAARDARLGKSFERINGELAAIRKGRQEKQPDGDAPRESGSIDSVRAELKAEAALNRRIDRALGRLETILPEEQFTELASDMEGKSAVEQAALLRGAELMAKRLGGAKPIGEERGEKPVAKANRGAGPAGNRGLAHPSTFDEWVGLAKSDPAKYRALALDPSFDVNSLKRNH